MCQLGLWSHLRLDWQRTWLHWRNLVPCGFRTDDFVTFYFSLCLSVSLWWCACACMCVRRCIFVGAHGSQRPFSSCVVPPQLSTLFFETGVSADQEPNKLGWWPVSTGVFLSLPSQRWSIVLPSFSYLCWGSQSGLHAATVNAFLTELLSPQHWVSFLL